MPPPELDYRFQKAVLWERLGVDRHNNPIVSAAQELCIRWENTINTLLDPDGQPIKLDGAVIVVQEIAIGSLMWEGKLTDVPENTDNISNLMEVVAFERTPDVKGRVFRRVAGLKRYTNKLPTVI